MVNPEYNNRTRRRPRGQTVAGVAVRGVNQRGYPVEATQTQNCAASASRQRVRRSPVINRAFQWKYAAAIMAIVFFLTSFLTMTLYDVLHRQARAMIISRGATISEVRLVMLFSALAFSAVTATALGAWSVFITHRICGPLHVMNRYLNELADGKLPHVRPLRAKDEFKEVHASLARAVASLRARRETELAALSRALELARGTGPVQDDMQRRALESVAQNLEKLCRETADALASGSGAAGAQQGSANGVAKRSQAART